MEEDQRRFGNDHKQIFLNVSPLQPQRYFAKLKSSTQENLESEISNYYKWLSKTRKKLNKTDNLHATYKPGCLPYQNSLFEHFMARSQAEEPEKTQELNLNLEIDAE